MLGQALLRRISRCSLDLVVIVVQPDDVYASELCNLPRRPTNATANVEDSHPVAETHHVCKVVLMAGNGLVEGLAIGEAAEMEGGRPAVFVEVGDEVVVAIVTH